MKGQESNDELAAEHARLRSDLVLVPLDGELVAFSEEAQCLVSLNASAAFVLRQLKQGRPTSDLVHGLISEGLAAPADAQRWVTAALASFSSHGLLADGRSPAPRPFKNMAQEQPDEAAATAQMPPYAPFEPAAERSYRLLETCVLIRFAHRAQLRLVDAVIGHMAIDDGEAPTVVIDIHGVKLDDGHYRSDVYRDGKPSGYAPRLSMLGPVVKEKVWQAAIDAHDFLFYIHAGVVGTGNSCVVMPAAAGSGKSSLTTALAHAGFSYFSDEVALIDRATFQVTPMPLAICVKSTGWKLMLRYYPNLAAMPIHWRGDLKRVRYIPPPAGAMEQTKAAVSHIVFPLHKSGTPTQMTPVSRSEALGRLMGECLVLRHRLVRKDVEKLVEWIEGIDCYELTFSSLDEAVALVSKVATRQKP